MATSSSSAPKTKPTNQSTSSSLGRKRVQRKPPTQAERKWGKKVMAQGFCIVPSLLIKGQRRLGLSPIQMNVLIQLCDYWWDKDRVPYPSKAQLAERLGVSPKTIQRTMAALEKAELIRRESWITKDLGLSTNRYHLDGLVSKIKALEPDFTEARVKADATKQRATRQRAR